MSALSTAAIGKLIRCRDARDHIKPVEYLIHGILPQDCKAALIGDYGTMKTFMAQSVGISIASGSNWFGRITVQRPVLYIVGEHANGFLIRLWTAVGEDKDIPLFTYPEPIRFLDPEQVEKAADLCKFIEEQEGNKPFVIIDTLNRNFGNGDENATRDMTTFTNQLDEFVFPYSSGFLLLHHTPKSGYGSRGSVVLPGYLDTELTITKGVQK